MTNPVTGSAFRSILRAGSSLEGPPAFAGAGGGILENAGHPVPGPRADDFHLGPARERHLNIVPASLVFIVWAVIDNVLAVKLGADFGDRLFQSLLFEETELLASGRLGHLLGRIVDENGFHVPEDLDE